MAETTTNKTSCGWKIEFPDAQGEKVQRAMEECFLGASVSMAINTSAQATLTFYQSPSSQEISILDKNNLPPILLNIKDSSGCTLFSGKAGSLDRDTKSLGRTIFVTYYDPIFWEMNDIAPFTYANGTLEQIVKNLTQNKSLTWQFDDEISIPLPAGGGDPVRLLDLVTKLANERAAFFFYHPEKKGRCGSQVAG